MPTKLVRDGARLPDGVELPTWHHEKILRLLALLEDGVAPLFLPGQEADRHHAVRVLWSSLYGICSLEASNKLIETESVEAMSDTLISNFLAGLRMETAPRAILRPMTRRKAK